MNDIVTRESRNGISIILVHNPPVNALSVDVRRGLYKAVEEATADPEIQALVIACSGRTFFSGADIREFGRPFEAPGLGDVINKIELCTKPVVAVIHGVALGGGLEVALGCHFRIATKDAKLGLPEVKLGLLPGAGGTQRLPRAVGPELALKLIVGGEPIAGREALTCGLIDALFEGSPVAEGEAFARRIVAERRPIRRLREDETKLAAAKADFSIFTAAAAAANKKSRGLEAPLACIEAVGWSLNVPFNEALVRESNSFKKLMSGEQSKAQRYAFFAEREAAKIAGIRQGTKAREISSVAVIGAGTMGGGIAMSFANAGIPVTIIELAQEPLDRGLGVIRKNYEATATRGGISPEDVTKRVGLIRGAIGLEAVADADLVVEAVFETMAVKLEIFGKLDKLAKTGAILATNTSYLDVNQIAAATSRPQDVLGMHFFSPANIMKLCEIVRGERTAADVLAAAVDTARRIRKVPVIVGVCHGFVGNRMLEARGKQASKLLYEGALPQQADAVLTKFGMPMGHFAMGDLAGLDIGWRSRQDRGEKAPIEDALCEAGRLGQKTGKGFFRYEGGSRSPMPDAEVEQLIVGTLARLGLKRREVGDDEILERLLYPMINEGARILEENIAARPSDVDVVWLYGYGWPVYRGGPMFYADSVGLKRIADRLEFYAAQDNDPSLMPAALLRKLADDGKTFASLAKSA